MRSKGTILSLLVLVSMLTVSLAVPSVLGTSGPTEDYLHITNWGTPDAENDALEAGTIDINDWSIDKDTIDAWRLAGKIYDPLTNPTGTIVLREYNEIGSYEYDLYCQRWPTGVPDCTEHPAEYDAETDSDKVYFDETNEWDVRAWGFRLALAYITDKDYISTAILKGFGNMFYAGFVPVPALEGFLDKANLTDSSFIYHGPNGDVTIPSLVFGDGMTRAQMTAKAEELLDAAGFTVNTGTGYRKDPAAVAGKTWAWGDTNDDLKPIVFYMRTDDPDRWDAGKKLADDMEAVGIRVDRKEVAKSVCFKKVMVEYDYHIYTGGYSYGADAWECIFGLFHSSQYWYPIGWSGGYQGFCHKDHDTYAAMVKDGATKQEIEWGVHNATFLENKYVCSIGLWTSKGIHAYRVGWENVVNHKGYGLTWGTGTHGWSFDVMSKDGTNTINWGFKSNPESFNPISAEWVWDYCVMDRIYDDLIIRNPFNLAEDTGFLAEDWEVGEWTYDGEDVLYCLFTLRDDTYFHNGDPVTPEDVKFSLEFMRDCGPGVCWYYMSVADIYNVTTAMYGEPTLASNQVKVYLTTPSFWALHLVGIEYVLNKNIWLNANVTKGWGYRWPRDDTGRFDDWNPDLVREYKPWEEKLYDSVHYDLTLDGTGPWIYVDSDDLLMEWYDLEANRNWYFTDADILAYLERALHTAGNVNYLGSVNEVDYPSIDSKVDTVDLGYVQRAWGSKPIWPTHGIGWVEWNADADIDVDEWVFASDLYLCGYNYLMTKEGIVY